MKKLILTFLLATITTVTFAQYSNTQSSWSFSVLIGGSFSFFNVKSAATAPTPNKPIADFCTVVSLGYKFSDYFSISPALGFLGKGGQTEYIYGISTDEVHYELAYVEESLRFIGHIPISEQADIFLGGGPYYANGFWGKATDNNDGSNIPVKFGRYGDFKSNDYGISTIIGFKAERGYSIGINFDLGLFNVHQFSPVYKNTDQFMNRAINLSIGYGF